MADNRESYDTESGLLTDYVGTVTDAWFAQNANINANQLNLKQDTDNAERPEHTEQIGIGAAWESYDGGKTVENKENTDKTKFHANSRMGEFIERLKTFPGCIETLAERGPAQDASVYVGLRFKWDEVEKPYSFKDRETGKLVEGVSRYNMPSAFLGTVENPTSALTSGTGTSTTPTASSPVSTESVLTGLPQDLIDQLTECRSLASTHSDFVDKAVQLTGVMGNATLIEAIADEDQLWKELG